MVFLGTLHVFFHWLLVLKGTQLQLGRSSAQQAHVSKLYSRLWKAAVPASEFFSRVQRCRGYSDRGWAVCEFVRQYNFLSVELNPSAVTKRHKN